MPKQRIHSRNKGGRGERELAKIFTAWWGTEFTRTPSSGAFATIMNRGDLNVAGDISTTDPKFPWVVEVKRHESVTVEQLLTAKKCLIFEWWQQASKSAKLEGKAPLLVFRKNNQPWLFAMYDLGLKIMPKGTHFYVVSPDFDGEIVIGVLSDLTSTDPQTWTQDSSMSSV